MLVERLKRKIQRENLWLFVMLLLLDKPRFASDLRFEIAKRFGFWSGKVTAYKVLYYLEDNNYVEVQHKGDRKSYAITESGLRLLDGARTYVQSIIDFNAGKSNSIGFGKTFVTNHQGE